MSFKLARRSFLRYCTLLGVLTLFEPSKVFGELGRIGSSNRLASQLISLFSNKDSAKIIGREYLKVSLEETSVHLLVDLVCSFRKDWGTKLVNASKRELQVLISFQQREDFEEGRTVQVQGWLLSVTEARLCALTVYVPENSK